MENKNAPRKFTIWLDDPTYRRLAARKIEDRRSMTSIIVEALRNHLDLVDAASKR